MPNLTIQYIVLISSVLLLVALLFVLLAAARKRKQKNQIPALDMTYLNQLYQALGGSPNIIKITREHQRLQVLLNSPKSVNADMLRYLNTPAFVKGKQMTLLIKNHTEEVLSFLDERRKEDY